MGVKAVEMKQVRAHVFVEGRVQGVFYRVNARDEAKDLGITGWIKNLEDGRVEAVFEGTENLVKEMVLWCKGGTRLARVDDVKVSWETHSGEFDGFQVVHD